MILGYIWNLMCVVLFNGLDSWGVGSLWSYHLKTVDFFFFLGILWSAMHPGGPHRNLCMVQTMQQILFSLLLAPLHDCWNLASSIKINFILLVAVQMLELLAMHHFIFLWLLWTLCHLLLNNLCHPSDDMIHISMLIKNTNCKYGNLFLFASVGLFILLLEGLCFQEWHFQLHKNGYGFYLYCLILNNLAIKDRLVSYWIIFLCFSLGCLKCHNRVLKLSLILVRYSWVNNTVTLRF